MERQKGVRIIVKNVDDTPPEFKNEPYATSIPEDTAVATTFFTGISATDLDSLLSNTIIFTIQSGNDQNQFAIAATGELSVAAALDYETKNSHELVIHAQEVTNVNPTQQTATAVITITILDVNDVAPDLPVNFLATVSQIPSYTHTSRL